MNNIPAAAANTDLALLQRYAVQRDAGAFSEIIGRYQNFVYSACYRVLGNAADAEDACQECFISLFQQANEVKESLAGWLHRCATRTSIDAVRSRAARKVREKSFVETGAFEKANAWKAIEPLVDQAIDNLPDEQRRLMIEHFLRRRSQVDIAAELGLSNSTISRRLDEAIEEVRSRLGKQGVAVSSAMFAALVVENAVLPVPASLTASFGKMAIAGISDIAKATGAAAGKGMGLKVAASIVGVILATGTVGIYIAQKSGGKLPLKMTVGSVAKGANGAVLGAADFYPSPEHPVGWRGDGSGRYPGADLPMEWGRWPKGPMKGIRSQAKKPANDQPGGIPLDTFAMGGMFFFRVDARSPENQKRPAELGGAKDWLTAGPFASKDTDKALDESQLPNETELQPDEGDKAASTGSASSPQAGSGQATSTGSGQAGDLTWERRYFNKGDKISKDGRSHEGVGLKPGEVLYTHTYLYCENAGALEMPIQHGGGVKVWLNGKVVFNNAADNAFMGLGHAAKLSLNKGWNRLLIKLTRWMDFWLLPGFGSPYESTNILWATKLPHMVEIVRNGNSPVVVGNKIFFTAEPADLICMDKNTGKILWIRPNTFYDTISGKSKTDLTIAQLSYAKARGKAVTINSSRPLDPAIAEKTSSCQIEGLQLEKAELGNNGRTIRLTAREPFKPGKELTVKFSGLKTADGFAVETREVKFTTTRDMALTGQPFGEFLLSRAFDIEEMKRTKFGVEKNLSNPRPGADWKVASSDDGVFDFSALNGNPGGGCLYVHAYVKADADGPAQAQCFRSGSSARVIVNGALVKEMSGPREINSPSKSEIVDVSFKKGWNSLLIGVCSHEGLALWGLKIVIAGGDGKPPAGLAYMADSPDSESGTVAWEEVAPPQTAVDCYAQYNSIKAFADKRKALNDEIVNELNAQISPQGFAPGSALNAMDEKLKAKRKLDDQIVHSMARIGKKFNPRSQTWGNCSATPCSDGEKVYVWYHFGVAAAYDLDGNLQWSDQHCLHAGTYYKHGDHGSPILVNGKFIICQTHNNTAYDCKTGSVIWRIDGGCPIFCSPVPAKIAGEDVFVMWNTYVNSIMAVYRVSDGKTLWKGTLPGIGSAHSTCGTPVLHGDRIFNTEESGVYEVQLPDKPDGPLKLAGVAKGNLWNDVVISPLYHEGIVYNLAYMNCELFAYDAEKHDLLYRAFPSYYPRDGARVWVPAASPILAGKYIYLFDNSGTTVVIEPGRTYKEVAQNRIFNFINGQTLEQVAASPVATGRNLIIRSCEYMYCIGEK